MEKVKIEESASGDHVYIELKHDIGLGIAFLILSFVILILLVILNLLMIDDLSSPSIFLGLIAFGLFFSGLRLSRGRGEILSSVKCSTRGIVVHQYKRGTIDVPFEKIEAIRYHEWDDSTDDLQIVLDSGASIVLGEFSAEDLQRLYRFLQEHFDGVMMMDGRAKRRREKVEKGRGSGTFI